MLPEHKPDESTTSQPLPMKPTWLVQPESELNVSDLKAARKNPEYNPCFCQCATMHNA